MSVEAEKYYMQTIYLIKVWTKENRNRLKTNSSERKGRGKWTYVQGNGGKGQVSEKIIS